MMGFKMFGEFGFGFGFAEAIDRKLPELMAEESVAEDRGRAALVAQLTNKQKLVRIGEHG